MAQTDKQKNRQTDGHGKSKTNSAQRGRVGEEEKNLPEKWFQKEESWFSALECQFSFCFHQSQSSSNFQLCRLKTKVNVPLYMAIP